MPLNEHDSGQPLINDEAYALSHMRISNRSHPGLSQPYYFKGDGYNGPKEQ